MQEKWTNNNKQPNVLGVTDEISCLIIFSLQSSYICVGETFMLESEYKLNDEQIQYNISYLL